MFVWAIISVVFLYAAMIYFIVRSVKARERRTERIARAERRLQRNLLLLGETDVNYYLSKCKCVEDIEAKCDDIEKAVKKYSWAS